MHWTLSHLHFNVSVLFLVLELTLVKIQLHFEAHRFYDCWLTFELYFVRHSAWILIWSVVLSTVTRTSSLPSHCFTPAAVEAFCYFTFQSPVFVCSVAADAKFAYKSFTAAWNRFQDFYSFPSGTSFVNLSVSCTESVRL